MNIHPTAIVHPKATVGEHVIIGPYCVIGEHVTIGDQTELSPHVCIEGHTDIGRCCRISPFVSIGTPPQHLQYKDDLARSGAGVYSAKMGALFLTHCIKPLVLHLSPLASITPHTSPSLTLSPPGTTKAWIIDTISST